MNILYEGTLYTKKEYREYEKELPKNISSCFVHMSRSPYMLYALYMLWTNGITYIPIDSTCPQQRVDTILSQVNADAMLTDSGMEVFQKSSEKQIGDSEIAYIAFTSGSTGNPKGIEVTRPAIKNFMEGICEKIDFGANKRIACLTNIAFDIFFIESLLPLSLNMQVVLANQNEQRNPRKLAKLIYNNRVEMLQMTPSRLQMLYNFDPELKSLHYVREILLGGESLPNKLLHELQKKTTAKIYNLYGPTETTVYSTISDLTKKEVVDIGTPIKGTKVVLFNSLTQAECVADEEGEICIGGLGVAKGYHNNPDLTSSKFRTLQFGENTDRYFFTGDKGKRNVDGSFSWLGRIDNQIKLNGFRIEPEEIEYYMVSYPGIHQCIVRLVTINESSALEALYTALSDIDKGELKKYLTCKLPTYMIPTIFTKIDEFQYTSNGKINRKQPFKRE